MDALKIRRELQRKDRKELFKILVNQRISKCLIGGVPCSFYLHYKELSFCVSEILGQGCQLEKIERLEEVRQGRVEMSFPLPFIQKPDKGSVFPEMKVEFRVYYRDDLTRSLVFLGKVIERRKKERGNNLNDLLKKAMRDFSDEVNNPFAIFLIGS
jgi:hypothetical protein